MKLSETRENSGFMFSAIIASLLLLAGEVFAQNVAGPYTTTAEAQVRNGPGNDYAVIATIPNNTKVNVVGKEGRWLRIESKRGRQPGYIDEQFVRPLSTSTAKASGSRSTMAGAYTTTTTVNLRAGPGTQHKVLRKIPRGVKINVVRAEGDWLRVESKSGNPPGYVHKNYAQRLS